MRAFGKIKFFLALLLFAFSVFALFASAFIASAQEELPIFEYKELGKSGPERYVPDEIIVKFKPDVLPEKINEIYQIEQILQEKYISPFAGFRVLKIPSEKNVEEMVYRFQKNPLVDYVEPNSIVQAFMIPNDPYYQYQWHFDDDHTRNPGGATSNPYGGANGGGIRMEDAWNITTGNSSIVVAVVDTGIAYENYQESPPKKYYLAPDLAGTCFVQGYDFINNDSHPNDDNSHGTHVTGTIAQKTNNSIGVAGIASNTCLMPVKVLNKNGSGTAQTLADGIYYATNNGAKIINMSLGWPPGYNPGTTVYNAIKYAYDHGVTQVAATGNDNASTISYPAKYTEVIAVGATRYDETRAPYSNYGEGVDLVSPGGDTSVDQNQDGYGDGVLQNTFNPNTKKTNDFGYWFFQGTSMSTPHVSGVAALLLAQDSNRTPDQIRNILQTTAEDKGDAGWDQYYGYGIVDAYAALTYAPPGVSISLTTDGTTPFGILALGATKDTTPTGTNDVQTVQVTTGPANLSVKSTNFSDGTNTWTLGSTNGANQVKWEFSKEATPSAWTTFSSANTLVPFDNNVAQGATRDLYLRLTMPTSTVSSSEHASTVTIVATAP